MVLVFDLTLCPASNESKTERVIDFFLKLPRHLGTNRIQLFQLTRAVFNISFQTIEFSWFGSLGGACRSQPRIYKYNQTTRECQPFFQFFFELFLHPSPYKGSSD